MKVAVTGSSGLIGGTLAASLAQSGVEVLRLVRDRGSAGDGAAFWDPANGELDPAALAGVDSVVHLSGLSVAAKRWSAARKAALRAARIDSGRLLAETIASMDAPPAVLVSASAVGIYGDRGDTALDEESGVGEGFLAELTADWEASLDPARARGVRVACARFGVVLFRRSDPLSRLVPLFRLGLGGAIGGGRQWLSWIHLDDAVKSIRFALDNDAVDGAFNAVAPNPVTNAEFAKALGGALRRPALLPAPAFAIRLAFGQMAVETILASTRALPKRLEALGFTFDYPAISQALQAEAAS